MKISNTLGSALIVGLGGLLLWNLSRDNQIYLPGKGTLSVESAPSDAIVQANDVTLGTTPLVIDIEPGSYHVILSKPGFEDTPKNITIEDGKTASVHFDLSPLPVEVPSLSFETIVISSYWYYGRFPIVNVILENHTDQPIVDRLVRYHRKYLSVTSINPFGIWVTGTTDFLSTEMFAFSPPGRINLLPGYRVAITNYYPILDLPTDVTNYIWLEDSVTGNKSEVVVV